MSCDFIKNSNEGVQNLSPYQPGKPIEELQRELGISNIVKLASNENPLGPSPKAIEAARKSIQKVHLYPDSSGFTLKQALAKHLNVEPETITLGNGSDNILQLLIQAYVKHGQEVLVSQYGFAMFDIISRGLGAKPKIVPAKNWGHDLAAMAKAVTDETRIIFIANPNNPTGTWANESEVKHLLDNVPEHVIVVLDEAYYEYVDEAAYPNSLQLQQQYPNLVVTRTFSKMYALAGLRIGYGIANPDITDVLNRIRLPFNVSIPSLVAACAALEDKAHQQRAKEINQQGMQQLAEAFDSLQLDYLRTVTNFLTVDVGRNAQEVYQALLQKGVIVRPLTPYKMLQHLRISIGLPEENQRLINALQEVL